MDNSGTCPFFGLACAEVWGSGSHAATEAEGAREIGRGQVAQGGRPEMGHVDEVDPVPGMAPGPIEKRPLSVSPAIPEGDEEE